MGTFESVGGPPPSATNGTPDPASPEGAKQIAAPFTYQGPRCLDGP